MRPTACSIGGMKSLRAKLRKWRQERAEKDAQKVVSQENWGNQKYPPGGGVGAP
jgi:hypothetical protein